jgi:hypothetical protein
VRAAWSTVAARTNVFPRGVSLSIAPPFTKNQIISPLNSISYVPCSKYTDRERSVAPSHGDAPPFFESAGRKERELLEEADGGGERCLRIGEKGRIGILGEDEGQVVMVWDGMTQEEQVIAKTVTSGEKDWVIRRMKPTHSKLGEDATGDQIHQEETVFLEEFGTRMEGVQPRGSNPKESQKMGLEEASQGERASIA